MTVSNASYDGSILQTFLILLGHLKVVDKETCEAAIKKNKPILSAGLRRRRNKDIDLAPPLIKALEQHKESIIEKDFSWVGDAGLEVGGVNLSKLVSDVWLQDDAIVNNVVAELLYLFYHVMDDTDKKRVNELYNVKKEDIVQRKAPVPKLEMNSLVQKIMHEHRGSIRAAENDPTKINEVISKIISSNTGDIVSMVSGMMDIGR